MIVVFLGAPGCGKGTQSQFLKESFGFDHIPVGDLLKKARQENQDLIKKINAGHLMDDSVVNALVEEKFDSCHSKKIILDGFPRTLGQAKFLDLYVKKHQEECEIVFFDVPEAMLWERVQDRTVCEKCQATYHAVKNPPQRSGFCDKCGGTSLVKRLDDQLETFQTRMGVYKQQTSILVDYYGSRLHTLNASQPIDLVRSELLNVLKIV